MHHCQSAAFYFGYRIISRILRSFDILRLAPVFSILVNQSASNILMTCMFFFSFAFLFQFDMPGFKVS